jgi:hypothetical protein
MRGHSIGHSIGLRIPVRDMAWALDPWVVSETGAALGVVLVTVTALDPLVVLVTGAALGHGVV